MPRRISYTTTGIRTPILLSESSDETTAIDKTMTAGWLLRSIAIAFPDLTPLLRARSTFYLGSLKGMNRTSRFVLPTPREMCPLPLRSSARRIEPGPKRRVSPSLV